MLNACELLNASFPSSSLVMDSRVIPSKPVFVGSSFFSTRTQFRPHIAGHSSFWCVASQKLAVVSVILAPGLYFPLLPWISWALGVHLTIWHCFKPQRAIHTVPVVSQPSLSPVAESHYLVSNHQNLHEMDLASGDWESVPSKMQERWRRTSHIKDKREISIHHSVGIFFLKLVYVCISTLLYNYRYLEVCMLTGWLMLEITFGFVLGMLMMHGFGVFFEFLFLEICTEIVMMKYHLWQLL